MESPIVVVLLLSCLWSATPHPKNSDILPKDYYKRQVLQPIPGYIPVYIQTDEEPVVRREKVKNNPNLFPQKVTQIEEINESKTHDKEISSKIEDDRTLKAAKNSPSNAHDKLENLNKVEHSKSEGKHDKVKRAQPLSGDRKSRPDA